VVLQSSQHTKRKGSGCANGRLSTGHIAVKPVHVTRGMFEASKVTMK
jgi:hypothetical protein